jgi:acyl carrier protein
MKVDEICCKIKRYIVDKFPISRARNLKDEDPLLEIGVLDSLGVLDVVAFIEKEFQITLSDEDLLPEHFQSVASLAAFVSQKLNGSTANDLEGK